MKLGRLPRTFDPRIPHLSALRMRVQAPPEPPPSCDYRKGVTSWGTMLNDRLGCCTIAGIYHAMQVWTLNSQPAMLTEPDSDVLKTYEILCGYNPADPSTDAGGVEQDVLRGWLQQPVWRGKQAQAEERLAAFVEVDPRNHVDVMQAIADCGLVYIGFDVPTYLMSDGPPLVWDVNPSADNTIDGGHCVVAPAYVGAKGLSVISWGDNYDMTWAFWDQRVNECYALVDKAWMAATGKSPLGLSLADLEAQMSALRAAA